MTILMEVGCSKPVVIHLECQGQFEGKERVRKEGATEATRISGDFKISIACSRAFDQIVDFHGIIVWTGDGIMH